MSKAELHRDGRLGILRIDNPPVNAIAPDLVTAMDAALTAFEADTSLAALVIECAGRTFVAGGDIAAFDDPSFSAGPFNALLARIEASDRPVVAALFGTVLGGGLELALACHARVATPTTRLGLPEITLGLIPGSLGTQRLPRLAGVAKACEMITSGKPISASAAAAAGIVDKLAEDHALAARELALHLAGSGAPIRRTRALIAPDADTAGAVIAEARRAAQARPWLPALAAVADCLAASVQKSFPDGEGVEARAFSDLVRTPQSRAMRHLFFAERAAQKIPGLSRDAERRTISRVGILGVGTMGAGIAMCFANAGYPLHLVETSQDGLDRGKGLIAAAYASTVTRGLISEDQAQARIGLMTGSTDMADLSDCDIVVEAVFEDMELKLSVARKLGAVCKLGAIIATNTSTLDVDRIARETGRAGDVLGTHFFSPAHIMKLLEVVRGKDTAPEVLATVMELSRRIRKTAVVSGVCYGFIGNRMAEVYMRESEAMQLEGAVPSQIDGVAENPAFLGMAMGPSRMLDMAGVDVGARTVVEWIKSGKGPQDPAYRILARTLYEHGQHGQKTGQGYYRYDNRKAVHSDDTQKLCRDLAQAHGVTRRAAIPDEEILERLLYPMINEAALILEDGIAYRPGDIDIVWTAGYGFPAWRGGPVFMADEIGLKTIVARMDHYAAALGNEHGYWTVAPLLRHLAETNSRLSDWQRHI
ncbi:3-hydroxyacyl-CoA dehydrogenase NAD-binding domain-containing protein [Antarcticimicrobium luteum]|uniref:Enoyl-CoA hydratase n=1 Tax=Antarcticimicrobium luteum TaxID=2547397 RepID=A0A4R5V1P7_9RHOB|nr:3-hydroxyacyl-CoA dehydrogenase NAD-binding domain-containing protein [Antarcticimicrobium luteum]TDK45720.1 enoyl-CoA hydratase [Antarcticimicrobium luteum]